MNAAKLPSTNRMIHRALATTTTDSITCSIPKCLKANLITVCLAATLLFATAQAQIPNEITAITASDTTTTERVAVNDMINTKHEDGPANQQLPDDDGMPAVNKAIVVFQKDATTTEIDSFINDWAAQGLVERMRVPIINGVVVTKHRFSR